MSEVPSTSAAHPKKSVPLEFGLVAKISCAECVVVVVHHVQGEHYQRNVLRVFVIVSGPVGNPESSSVQSP